MTTSVIDIENLRFSYDETEPFDWVLSVPRFAIGASDLCLLSGDNMSGKTTFLKLLAGLLPPNLWSGVIEVRGESVREADLGAESIILSADDGMFPELTVLQNIWLGLPRSSASRLDEVAKAALPVFAKSDIFDLDVMQRPLGDLSSGGRALVKLARAYVSDRPLVIVDEISSFLDKERATVFLDALLELRDRGRAVLIVSHNQRDREYLKAHGQVTPYHIRRSLDVSVLAKVQL